MTTKPETKFWKKIKSNSSKIIWTRIEAITPLGLPDLNGFFNDPEKGRGDLWVELKIIHDNRIRISKHQISWHFHRNKMGGKSFIMATPLPRGAISVYSGGRVKDLVTQGLNLEPCGLFPEPIDWSGLETWFINA